VVGEHVSQTSDASPRHVREGVACCLVDLRRLSENLSSPIWVRPRYTIAYENDGTFDELVVDDWLHIEQMDASVWWMRVGDVRLLVTLNSEGQRSVDVLPGAPSTPSCPSRGSGEFGSTHQFSHRLKPKISEGPNGRMIRAPVGLTREWRPCVSARQLS